MIDHRNIDNNPISYRLSYCDSSANRHINYYRLYCFGPHKCKRHGYFGPSTIHRYLCNDSRDEKKGEKGKERRRGERVMVTHKDYMSRSVSFHILTMIQAHRNE